MERYLKISEAVEKSQELKETLTLIQDAETRIKSIVFHSFLTSDNGVEVIILRIIDEAINKLPDSEDKEHYKNDLLANANHWLMIARIGNIKAQELRMPTIKIELRDNGTINEWAYKQFSTMFEKGQPRQADYSSEVLRLTKTMLNGIVNDPLKAFTVNYEGLVMKTNISIRAAAERRIRDKIHQEDINAINKENPLVWISSHADCSERCEPWQGRLYSTDGTSGEIEGHKFIPIEVATNSNMIITSLGKQWNNSVLVGFNCRHYTIPFVPGTVPVIRYDEKIVAREREITKTMREMEREIIKEKTRHKLLVEAEKNNNLNLPKHSITRLIREAATKYRTLSAKYQNFCNSRGRAYHTWRTQILVDRQEMASSKPKCDK